MAAIAIAVANRNHRHRRRRRRDGRLVAVTVAIAVGSRTQLVASLRNQAAIATHEQIGHEGGDDQSDQRANGRAG